MALKSKEWFYKQCLNEVKKYSPLCHLCWDILEKGMGQRDNSRGHVTQAIGACQEFLQAYSVHIPTIKSSDPTHPYNIVGNSIMQANLKSWISSRSGAYGRSSFGYNFDTLKRILTPSLGGTCSRGGGGDDEFKRVLRIIVHFS